VKYIYLAAILTTALTLSACSSIVENEKIDYRGTVKAPSLDVPPDMTQLTKETRYTVVGGSVSASALKSGATSNAKETVALASAGDFRIERSGAQRWIVTKKPADKLWEPIKDFWKENGLPIALEDSKVGVMETGWAENRARIPQDFIRSTIGKLFDGLYSSGERDKYRTRIERDANGNTEIYVTHRGMEEVYVPNQSDATVWQRRASDAELENEFLRRLMVKLGASTELAATALTDTPTKAGTTVTTTNGLTVISMGEGFDRAWRRVGLALDRTGFTVEDRDRKQGIYFVRYVPAIAEKSDQGFFSKLFNSDSKNTEAAKFQITVRSQDDVTRVAVLNGEGAAVVPENAQRILKVLAEELK
jgi:outer membrane protein assembly factor BamC